jgi:hypothetical protein
MLGWMLIFLLLLLWGALAATKSEQLFLGLTPCLFFGFLLVVSGFSLLLRGRA